jgi:hypothetical protein
MMKRLAVILIATVILFGCKKDNKDIKTSTPDTPPKTYTNQIVLNDLKIMDDSIKLSWSLLDTSAFVNYTLLRKDYGNAQMTMVKQLYKKDQTAVTDNAVPYSPLVQYQVEGRLSSGKVISSNVLSYSRPEIKILDVIPFDVQLNSADQTLYFFEKSGKISIYSLSQNTIIKSISTNATIGYCDFGMYNGRKEIYVPRNDGWVFIYDASTLEKVDQIATGLSNSCVVFNNNNLYVSTAAWTNRPLKVYNRQTGKKISETGDFELTRFKYVPNSNFELLEITINIGPVDQDYYRFATDGTFINHSDDRYHGDYPLDAGIFEFFPDGSKYITSSSGAIYKKDMTYEGSLPRGNLMFTTFALSQTDKLIYAGIQTKNIEVYSMTDYQRVKTINTKGYPYKLFDLGNQILSVSSITQANPCTYCQTQLAGIVIEKLIK